MDFSLNPEQEQLRDAIRRYLGREYGFEARRAIIRGAGTSPAAWAGLTELGLFGLTVPEAHGGFGGSGVDRMVVMEECGRALVVEPYFATAILGVACLVHAGNVALQARLLPQVAEGTVKLTVATTEAQSRHEWFNVATTARAGAGGYVLDGAKCVVLHGAQADHLVIPARTAGGSRDRAGISLFVVGRGAKGLTVEDYRTIDGMRAADLRLDGVVVDAGAMLGAPGEGVAILERMVQVGAAALCAEAVGCMLALNEQTLEYLKTRVQFGMPIGRFQVLQHRAVEMFMEAEQARSLAMLAAVKVDSDDAAGRARAVHAAKARVGRAARFVGQSAIQLHGGMGMTDELAAGHYFKRLTMIEATLGDTDHHLAAFAQLRPAA